MFSESGHSGKFPCYRIAISFPFFFAQKAVQANFPLDFTFYACSSIHYSRFWILDPHSLPIVYFCMSIVSDKDSITFFFASWARFVVQFESLFEHTGPANQVVVAFFRYAIILYLTCADETSRYFLLFLLSSSTISSFGRRSCSWISWAPRAALGLSLFSLISWL